MMNRRATTTIMKYGQISENKENNYTIYRCFEHLCEKDQQRFAKKFREQPHDSDQRKHTFRELVLGAYLSSRGFRVRHEYSVEGKTPDWCILDNRSAVVGIVELVNFHIDAVMESEIEKERRAKPFVVYWRDEHKNNVERLYHCIQDKMQKYQALTEKLGVPYIIAISPDYKVVLDFQEVLSCLHDNEFGLFQMYRHVGGVLYFEKDGGQYCFRYEQNPNRKFDLLSGVFSLKES